MKDILKLLNVTALDESQQTTLKDKLETIIDVKSRERADGLLGEEKKGLIKEYEDKFEDYKKDITSKFSNFVDSVLDEELQIPEKIVKYARKGELYDDLIEQFKIRLAVDEGLLNDEVKGLLKEAKDEIIKLKKEVNTLMSKNIELEEDSKEMATHIYLRRKCDGLTESQRTKVLDFLGDIKDSKEIDKKFKVVMEALPLGAQMPDAEAHTNLNICPCCGADVSVLGPDSAVENCPNCGCKMKDGSQFQASPAMPQGGRTEVTDPPQIAGVSPTRPIGEGVSPFDEAKKGWLKILKENKI